MWSRHSRGWGAVQNCAVSTRRGDCAAQRGIYAAAALIVTTTTTQGWTGTAGSPTPPPSSCSAPRRCARVVRQALCARKGPQVREGPWPQEEPRLQELSSCARSSSHTGWIGDLLLQLFGFGGLFHGTRCYRHSRETQGRPARVCAPEGTAPGLQLAPLSMHQLQ